MPAWISEPTTWAIPRNPAPTRLLAGRLLQIQGVDRAHSVHLLRTATIAAGVMLAGLLLSGPVGLGLVSLHPQPAWTGAQAAARAYHSIQTVPYWAGFLLVGGALGLVAALHALARPDLRARTGAALGFAAAFAALIFLNYVLQMTFVPALMRDYTPQQAPLIAAFSLANPRSLGWALEMWGYAVLGVATWLVAPVFAGDGRLGRATAGLFVANGPVSIAGGLLTAWRPGWVMTPVGTALFVGWNLLVAATIPLAIVVLRRRARAAKLEER
jgi:hypothetical protein